jgi:hypothetical protein
VGQLLAAPPRKGELRAQLDKLAARTWCHPISGEPACFSVSTLERWYYRARKERQDPVGVLRRKRRSHVEHLFRRQGQSGLAYRCCVQGSSALKS